MAILVLDCRLMALNQSFTSAPTIILLNQTANQAVNQMLEIKPTVRIVKRDTNPENEQKKPDSPQLP